MKTAEHASAIKRRSSYLSWISSASERRGRRLDSSGLGVEMRWIDGQIEREEEERGERQTGEG